jgi:hypothetical protein
MRDRREGSRRDEAALRDRDVLPRPRPAGARLDERVDDRVDVDARER